MAYNIDMAGGSYGIDSGIIDRRWTPTDVSNTISPTIFAASQDLRTLDTWLVAQNAGYWTATRLLQESFWDKTFWLRNQDSPTSLA